MATNDKKIYPVNIRLSHDMREQLRALADAENRPLANYIVTVLKEHLGQRTPKKPAK